MLAYLLWHRPTEGIEREIYERACERFHRSLHHSPPAGLRGSAVYRAGELPWLANGYEDWYFLDDFAALGVLNEAAVGHGHRSAHDALAQRFGAGAGGLYSLLEGTQTDPSATPLAVWVARPPGTAREALGELLGDGMDPQHASLWRRQLVLGPAPEYCLLTPEPPAGTAPTRLPDGWRATVCERETIWRS